MSNAYVPVSWNPFKKRYDIFLWTFIVIYLSGFLILTLLFFPQLLFVTILIRAFGTLAIILLHFILLIGPICRLQPKFLPLLYNRRHLGVTMFFIASVHAVLSLIWFHTGGYVHPLISLCLGNTHYESLIYFPFQTLGFLAYIILMIMAFTSHDFWLNHLSPRVWKGIHMLVYLAYSLLIMHVMLGIIQLENSPMIFLMLMFGLVILATVHILAGIKEWRFDHHQNKMDEANWIYVCEAGDIEDSRAKMAIIDGERVAIFRYGNKLSAVHNVCKHQNGPLGEGKIVDGCITCPWHGYQYQPEDGCAPAPFTEKLATYELKLKGPSIFINPVALPEGTAVRPAILEEKDHTSTTPFFIGWSNTNHPSILQFVNRFAFGLFALGLLVSIGFTSQIRHIAHSSFDYDHLKDIKGQLISFPFPGIRTISGKDRNGSPIIKTYPLVNDSKFGANGIVASMKKKFDSEKYTTLVNGAVIERGNTTAMELSNGFSSVKMLLQENKIPKAALVKLGDSSLIGEIIDTKCYLGAMNPGEGKPHRSCAILCIGGGIMPMVSFRGRDGKMDYAMLLGPNGETINKEVLKYVAEPVLIMGKLYRFDNWYVLYTNPKMNIQPLFH